LRTSKCSRKNPKHGGVTHKKKYLPTRNREVLGKMRKIGELNQPTFFNNMLSNQPNGSFEQQPPRKCECPIEPKKLGLHQDHE